MFCFLKNIQVILEGGKLLSQSLIIRKLVMLLYAIIAALLTTILSKYWVKVDFFFIALTMYIHVNMTLIGLCVLGAVLNSTD